MDNLKGRCATCQHWRGDKEKALAMFDENPLSMDFVNGWPDDGGCYVRYHSINIDIDGDAYVELTMDANFGCVHWEATEEG